MDILMIVLRLIHIVSGVFWAGTTFFLASHLTPAVKATAPEGQKVMQYLAGKSSMSNALAAAAVLSLLSGLIMFYLQGWQDRYMTASGTVLGIGVVVGIAAVLHGSFAQRRAILAMQALGMEIAAGGSPPNPDQSTRMGALAGKIERNGVILSYLLGITVVLMGTFQYF